MSARTLQSSQRAQKNRVQRGIVLGTSVLVVGGFVWGIVSLLRSDYFNVARLDVVGVNAVSTESLSQSVEDYFTRHSSLFSHKRSWLALSSEGLSNHLKASVPILENATVERNGLGALTVTLTERQPYAQMCSVLGNALVVPCYHIDSKGIIFDETASSTIESAHIKIGHSDYAPSLGAAGETINGATSSPVQFDPYLWEGITRTITTFEKHGLIIDSLLVVSTTTLRIDVGSFVIKAPLFGESGSEKVAENIVALLIQKFNWHKGMQLPQLDYIDARYGNALFYRTLSGENSSESVDSGVQ